MARSFSWLIALPHAVAFHRQCVRPDEIASEYVARHFRQHRSRLCTRMSDFHRPANPAVARGNVNPWHHKRAERTPPSTKNLPVLLFDCGKKRG
jgi:hypothetical protein